MLRYAASQLSPDESLLDPSGSAKALAREFSLGGENSAAEFSSALQSVKYPGLHLVLAPLHQDTCSL